MHPTNDFTDLLGTPFEQMKCWELVAEVYRRSGIELPNYTDVQMGDWQEIREPGEMNVLVFALYGKELHPRNAKVRGVYRTHLKIRASVKAYIQVERRHQWLI